MKQRILLVDDDEGMLELVEATLGSDGTVDILVAKDGKEALNLVNIWRPCLIFLDINMPNVNGFDVCKALKSDPATSGIRVVMLTSRSSEADRRKALDEYGADDYISKPFSPVELFQKFQGMLADFNADS